jgi:hypothetical protein
MRSQIALCLFALFTSCVSAETEKNNHPLHSLIVSNLRFRRPITPSIDPKVGPGGTDYRIESVNGAKSDCQNQEKFFKELKLDDVRTCLKGLKQSVTLHYLLRRDDLPYLELDLDESDEIPDCVQKTLAKIPVPREIIFQSSEEGELHCYSSRLDIELDRFLTARLPIHRFVLEVELPRAKPDLDTSDEALQRRLLALSLSPYFDEDKHISSRILTERLCAACIGPDQLFTPRDPRQPLWP